jgi:integrase
MIRTTPDGRRVRISMDAKRARFAMLRQQHQIEADSRNQTVVALNHSSLTLEEGFKRCFEDPLIWGRIKATQMYRALASHLETFFGPHRLLETISTEDVKQYVRFQLEAGYATATINNRLTVLSRMYSAMRECDDGPKVMPRFRQFKETPGRKFTLSYEDEEELFAAVLKLNRRSPGPRGRVAHRLDAHLYCELFQVLVETGLRLGEALNLRWTDLVMNTSDSLIKLYRSDELKNGKARTVPMTVLCRTVMDFIKKRGDSAAGPFGNLNKRRAEYLWNQAARDIRFYDRECVIHCLRHTCATRLLKATGNIVLVKEWLGHTTIETTVFYYAHVETESLLSGASALVAQRRDHAIREAAAAAEA